jgi:hypothetical protein
VEIILAKAEKLISSTVGTDHDLFWLCRQSQFFISLFSFFTSLHVSASTGHPQVKYTQSSCLKAITPTTDPFLGHRGYYFILGVGVIAFK